MDSTDVGCFFSLQKVQLDTAALDAFCITLEMNLKRINVCFFFLRKCARLFIYHLILFSFRCIEKVSTEKDPKEEKEEEESPLAQEPSAAAARPRRGWRCSSRTSVSRHGIATRRTPAALGPRLVPCSSSASQSQTQISLIMMQKSISLQVALVMRKRRRKKRC